MTEQLGLDPQAVGEPRHCRPAKSKDSKDGLNKGLRNGSVALVSIPSVHVCSSVPLLAYSFADSSNTALKGFSCEAKDGNAQDQKRGGCAACSDLILRCPIWKLGGFARQVTVIGKILIVLIVAKPEN